MSSLRAIIRLIFLIPATVLIYLTCLAGLLVCRLRPAWRPRWRFRSFRFWARLVARTLGVRIEIEGPVPSAPFYLVSNHLSYLDIIILACHLDCVFVAKADIEKWPFINRLCSSVGTIFIKREMKKDILRVNKLIERTVADKSGIILFPEATTSNGKEIKRFKPSLLETAVAAGMPVHYCTLTYWTAPGEVPAGDSVCWWGEAGFGGHAFQLFRLSRIGARIAFGPEPVRAGDRKTLADELWRSACRIFTPVDSPADDRSSPMGERQSESEAERRRV